MAGESFRFLHASDFHLECPLSDIEDIPEHLAESMVKAPRDAVQSIFDAAVADNIDFVVFSGDLLKPDAAGPYGLSQLLEGFECLREMGKSVFWSTGLVDDPSRWPADLPLPDNVTVFSQSDSQIFPVHRSGRSICRVVGRSCDGNRALQLSSFALPDSELFTVGVAYGEVQQESLSKVGCDYWALGGRHQPTMVEQRNGYAALYPGTPQGRSLQELGHHGYQVIDVNSEGSIRVQGHVVDTYRYCRVLFDDQDLAAMGSVENLIGEKIYRLLNEHGSRHLLIAWEYQATDASAMGLIQNPDRLLQWARSEYGVGEPAAWSLSITIRPPDRYPQSWREEETVLGDFLRSSSKYRELGHQEVDLRSMICDLDGVNPALIESLTDLSEPEFKDTLQRATCIGTELLRGGPSTQGRSQE